MLATVKSAGLLGIEGYPVEVEVDRRNGDFAFTLVGLPDSSIRESQKRILRALSAAQYRLPQDGQYTVNLAPANVRKVGTLYDLPIAACLVAAQKRPKLTLRNDCAVFGELGLDGTVRAVHGLLPMILSLRERGIHSFVIPAANAAETAWISGITVYPARHVREAVDFLTGDFALAPLTASPPRGACDASPEIDFADLQGQVRAKRAVEIAAAGGHNLLLIGPPGTGKTSLAHAMVGILPPLARSELLEVLKIRSLTGGPPHPVLRPFRAPHHTLSAAALVGGGPHLTPGEATRAHCGVLFLDEFPEFSRAALEALRQPIEDGVSSIARAAGALTYPARFTLVAAMNPCPCGYAGDARHTCRCSARMRRTYRARLSGPLLDRIDLQVRLHSEPRVIAAAPRAESSSEIRARVAACRACQEARYACLRPGLGCNAELNSHEVEKFCILSSAAKAALKDAMNDYAFSARAYTRILKVARTLADLQGVEKIDSHHIIEAVGYRALDAQE